MGIVKNKTEFFKTLRAADTKARERFKSLLWNVLELLHHEVMERTPVWSGSAVTNYRWSVGAPDYTFYDPIDNGPPGPTNDMPLGPEPRRADNEAASLTSLYTVNLANPFQVFWLNDNDPDIMGLEYGLLPPEPLTQRSRNGMARVSMEYVSLRVSLGTL